MTPDELLKKVNKLTRSQCQTIIVIGSRSGIPYYVENFFQGYEPLASTIKALVRQGFIFADSQQLTDAGWHAYIVLMDRVLQGDPLFMDKYVPKY